MADSETGECKFCGGAYFAGDTHGPLVCESVNLAEPAMYGKPSDRFAHIAQPRTAAETWRYRNRGRK